MVREISYDAKAKSRALKEFFPTDDEEQVEDKEDDEGGQ